MDNQHIALLIQNGSSLSGIAQARADAKAKYAAFPKLGCAAYLSSLMRNSGIEVPFTLGAGALASTLRRQRGWKEIEVGKQRPGDVGVCYDYDTAIPGSDHVYLVLVAIDNDAMTITDNQADRPHSRFASGRGKTPTEYFLRAI